MPFKNHQDQIRYIKDRRTRRRAEAIELKGGKCENCGYAGLALVFHHRNPSEKSMSLDVRAFTRSMEVLLPELEKCDLLCANCHIEHHGRIVSTD